jgi:type IV pilus assembly protein PilF
MSLHPVRIVVGGLGLSLMLGLLGACSTTVSTSSGPVSDARAPAAPTAPGDDDASRRARVRMELASAYFSRGQLDIALEEVRLALAADPNLGGAYNLRGLIHASKGDEALAEESFRKALQINARDTDSMQNFGWYLCQRKRYAEADALFGQAINTPQNRDVSRPLLAQGVCQAFAGQLAEAERTLTRAYELDAANPSIAVNLSEVLYRRGEFERARFYIRRINSQPAMVSAQTLWLAARIENKLGNLTGAQEIGRQLRNRFGESREAAAFDRGQFND